MSSFQSFVKIVRTHQGLKRHQRSLEDIAQRDLHIRGKRPLIAIKDPHEAVEAALCAYAHGHVPAISERDARISIIIAEKYRIDSLVCDRESLAELLPYLVTIGAPLESITLVDMNIESLDANTLSKYAKHVSIQQL